MFNKARIFAIILISIMALSIVGKIPLSTVNAQSGDESELDPLCLGKDEAFMPYADALTVYCDDVYMYIEADSLADHDMMIGITAWNQQVPIPQHFDEDNPWMIPLHPVMADGPTPTPGQGPMAVAINGVMIFNPTQQSGIYDEDHDPHLIGELDGCGGHSGRADDYHYHIAPICVLEALAEDGDPTQPIAYAIDGFLIYGFTNPDGNTPTLDECGGEYDENGDYHYHARPEYPYVNGCFSGVVNLSLQPATHPIRPAGQPIQVLITDYYEAEDGWIHLEYDFEGDSHAVIYREDEEGCYTFRFENATETHSEQYCGQLTGGGQYGDGGPPPNNGDNPPPPPDGNGGPPPQN